MRFAIAVRRFLLFVAVALLLGGCSEPEIPARQFTFSVVTAPDSSVYKAAVKFSELVGEKSKGRITISVHPNAQLANGNQLREFEMLREGKIDFTYNSNMFYASLDKRFGALSLPWAFSDLAEVDRFIHGAAGEKLLAAARPYGIVGLAYGENGFRQITNSKREIRKPADLNGLRLRVPNVPVWFSVLKTFGAEPVVMTWPAVYKALQEGVVEGQENPLDIIVSNKIYEVQRHITIWNYIYDCFILGVNAKLYDSLDAPTRKILEQAAVEASAYQVRMVRDSSLGHIAFLKEKGIRVSQLSGEELQAFRQLLGPIYDEYETAVGREMMAALPGVAGRRTSR